MITFSTPTLLRHETRLFQETRPQHAQGKILFVYLNEVLSNDTTVDSLAGGVFEQFSRSADSYLAGTVCRYPRYYKLTGGEAEQK